MKKRALIIIRAAQAFSAFLLGAALALSQVLIGGVGLLFSMPAYGLLGLIAILALLSLRQPPPKPDQFCLASSAVFFGYILARALLSPVPYLARVDIYSVLAGLLVYFFVVCIFTDARRRLLLVGFLLVVAMVHVLIGAIQFRQGHNFMLIPFLHRYDYGRRASGFYVCPNHLAGLLEVVGAFGLSIVAWSRWRTWAKLLTGYAVGVCYLGVVLTGSRGGYLSTVASLLVFFGLSLAILRQASARLFWRIGPVSVIAAAIIGIAVVLLVQKSNFLSGRAQNMFEKTNMRVDLWKAALEQWKLAPVFGTGSGTYLFYGRQFRTERMQLDPVRVHNDYLHLLAEYGLAGAAGFLIFLWAHLRRGWKNLQRLGPKQGAVSSRVLSNRLALQIGALCAVVAYIVHSAFDFNLHIPANVLLLAFVFGVLANSGIRREAEQASPTISLVLCRLALPVIGVIVLVQGFRLVPAEYFARRARKALRHHRGAEAVQLATRGLASERRNPTLYYYLGRGQALQGDAMPDPPARTPFYEAAITAFENGRALAPRDKTLAVELGFTYDALDRFAEAEWMFDEALQLDPKSTSTLGYYKTHLKRWRQSGSPSVSNPSAPITDSNPQPP